MSLTEILEEVTKLSADEKRAVFNVLSRDEKIVETRRGDEERQLDLLRRLEAEGDLRFPANYGKPLAPRSFEPVSIKGVPLSQTIIEERG